MAASEDALREVPDVGPTVAGEIHDFFASEQNQQVLAGLREHGVAPQPVEAETGDELAGLTFVFTGSLDGYTRGDAQDLVERAGGSATSSVSGNTDYLVVGENAGQRKREDAEENDVEELTEAAFEALLRDAGVPE
jgi:DNA ligase (NAD+)